jgi:ATP-dependent DNA ligase
MPITAACRSSFACLQIDQGPGRLEWLHEIKNDGYRLNVERDGDRVRLITRSGYN